MLFTPTRLERETDRLAWSLAAVVEGDPERRGPWFVRAALRYYSARWDLIPDMIPGLGLLDDYLVMALAAQMARVEPRDLPDHMDTLALHAHVRAVLAGRSEPPSLPAAS